MNALPGASDKSKLPIIVFIGCSRVLPHEALDHAEQFRRFFRRQVRAAAGSLVERQSDFPAGHWSVPIHILRRLREERDPKNLFRRVHLADLVILDAEKGCAEVIRTVQTIMSVRGKSASLFLLSQAGSEGTPAGGVFPDLPVDFSFTRYELFPSRGRPTFRLCEPRGFAAALESSLLAAGRERGL